MSEKMERYRHWLFRSLLWGGAAMIVVSVAWMTFDLPGTVVVGLTLFGIGAVSDLVAVSLFSDENENLLES